MNSSVLQILLLIIYFKKRQFLLTALIFFLLRLARDLSIFGCHTSSWSGRASKLKEMSDESIRRSAMFLVLIINFRLFLAGVWTPDPDIEAEVLIRVQCQTSDVSETVTMSRTRWKSLLKIVTSNTQTLFCTALGEKSSDSKGHWATH